MNKELDKVWKEVYRVLKVGGIACINIGDATRSIKGKFQIYTNHARITNYCLSLGFHALPEILWVKETNKPVIISTGMSSEQEIDNMIELFDDYLMKPILPDDLIKTIAKFLIPLVSDEN